MVLKMFCSQCCVPEPSALREFVSRPPIGSVRLHCTMIRHDEEYNLSSGTCYTLYLEYLGGLVPLLKGKRTSKIRPEFVIFDPQVEGTLFIETFSFERIWFFQIFTCIVWSPKVRQPRPILQVRVVVIVILQTVIVKMVVQVLQECRGKEKKSSRIQMCLIMIGYLFRELNKISSMKISLMLILFQRYLSHIFGSYCGFQNVIFVPCGVQ